MNAMEAYQNIELERFVPFRIQPVVEECRFGQLRTARLQRIVWQTGKVLL
jgi:hypothetical protein